MTSKRALRLLRASVLGLGVAGSAHADQAGKTGEGATGPVAAKELASEPTITRSVPKHRTGTPEPAIAGEGPLVEFLRAVHQKVHARFSENFLPMADEQLPKTHPVNDPALQVVLEVSITRSGKVAGVAVKTPSGTPAFDDAAIEVINDSRTFVPAPEAALSDDGNAHLLWTFSRDHRRCAAISSVNKESALEVAVPRLVEQGREGEALRRLKAAPASSREAGVTAFARLWLRGALAGEDKKVALVAAAALASAGDGSGTDLLRTAVEKGENVPVASRALARLRAPICPLVRARLEAGNDAAKAVAVTAIRDAAAVECVPALSALALDRAKPAALRVAAIEALGTADDVTSRKALLELGEDPSPGVRAAAVFASARPGGGRGTLFRLTPMLRDPSLDVRTAAAAGLVRAVGEPALEQLYLLFKEKDARPYEATAAQLAHMESEASAELLARFLRKEDKRIRVAAAAALATRSDVFARKYLPAVLKDDEAEIRLYGSAALPADERTALINAAGPAGRAAFRALSAGGRPAASDWLLSKFAAMDAASKAEVLGEWLAAGRRTSSSVATTARAN